MLILLLLIVAAWRFLGWVKAEAPFVTPALAYDLQLMQPVLMTVLLTVVISVSLTWSLVNANDVKWMRRVNSPGFISGLAEAKIARLKGERDALKLQNAELWRRLDALREVGGLIHANSMVNTETARMVRRHVLSSDETEEKKKLTG